MKSLLFAMPDWLKRVAEALDVDGAKLLRVGLRLAVIWALCWVALRIVGLIARRIESAMDDGDDRTMTEREQRGRTISQLLRSVGKVVVLGIGALLSLNVFIDIGPILAGAGILGLAVSFGAQSLVKDVISGFFYLMEGQFAVGDVIEVAGKSGVVERMTLRMVVLRDVNGAVHMVPNGQITTVSNMTRKWGRAVVDVGVAYGTDVDRALAIFLDEAHRFALDPLWGPRFDGEPEVVGVQELHENQVTIRTQLRTQAGQQWAIGREFRRRIKKRLDQEGIEIPYPQRTIHVRYQGGEVEAAPPIGLSGPRPPRPSQFRSSEGSSDA